MKRFLIFASACAFALTVFQSGGADVSVNFFYDNLNGGNCREDGEGLTPTERIDTFLHAIDAV